MTANASPSFTTHFAGISTRHHHPLRARRLRLLMASALGLSFAALPAQAAELLDGRLKIDGFLSQGFKLLKRVMAPSKLSTPTHHRGSIGSVSIWV